MLFLCMNAHVLSCSNMSNSLRVHRLWPARLLCPWDSLGKNTGVGCHAFLQGSSWPRDWTSVSHGSCIAGGFFTAEAPGKPPCMNMCYHKPIVSVFLHIVFIFFCVRSELIFSLTDWTLPHGETSALNRRYYAWWGLPLWQDPTDSVPVFILKMAIYYCSNSQVQCWDRLPSQSWSLPQAICYT